MIEAIVLGFKQTSINVHSSTEVLPEYGGLRARSELLEQIDILIDRRLFQVLMNNKLNKKIRGSLVVR